MNLRDELTSQIRRTLVDGVLQEISDDLICDLRDRIEQELLSESREEEQLAFREQLLEDYYDQQIDQILEVAKAKVDSVLEKVPELAEKEIGSLLSQLRIRAANLIGAEMDKFTQDVKDRIAQATIALQEQIDRHVADLRKAHLETLIAETVSDLLTAPR